MVAQVVVVDGRARPGERHVPLVGEQARDAQLLTSGAIDILRHAAVGVGGNSFMFSRPSCHNGCISLQI